MTTAGISTAIAWIEGQWGTAASLQLPLDDRALLLADGLFETVLIRNGAPQLLQEHLQRWSDSAALLGMDPPPQRDALEPLLEDAIQRSQLSEADGALRLNWSRGSSPQRGIGLPAPGHHRFWLTLQACTPTFSAVTTITSRHERRNASSRVQEQSVVGPLFLGFPAGLDRLPVGKGLATAQAAGGVAALMATGDGGDG